MQMQHSCTEELKQVNLKSTPARVAVMKLFESQDKPVDVQQVIGDLADKLDIDRVTVYRILNAFTQKGLLRKIEFGEGKARYELNRGKHHHLICKGCGNIEDISNCNIESLEKDIQQKKGFKVSRHSLEFFGLCKICQN